MPSTRSLAAAGSVLAVLAFAGLTAAQSPSPGSEFGLGTGLAVRFGVAFVVNLVLAGLLVAFGPRYARRSVREIRDDPGSAFVWGLLVGIGVPIVLVLLAITIVGLIVAIPGLIVLAVLGVVGTAVTIVWVGDSLTGGRDAAGGTAVVVGAATLAVAAAIPVLGNLIVTVLGCFGLGVVGRGLYETWSG